MKRKLRSSDDSFFKKELQNLPNKRVRKENEKYALHQKIEREKKQTRRSTTSHFEGRSIEGDFFALVHDLSDLNKPKDQLDQGELQILENLEKSKNYYNKKCDFDTSPRKRTPTKAKTRTPRGRWFTKRVRVTLEQYENSEKNNSPKILRQHRWLFFQEEKDNQIQELKLRKTTKAFPNIGKLKKMNERLKEFQSPDGSQIITRRTIDQKALTRVKNQGKKSRHGKGHVPAKEFEPYIEGQIDDLELSHSTAVSQNGPVKCAYPTSKGFNSTRIPIEFLVTFFIKKLKLSVKSETIAYLLKNPYPFFPYQFFPIPSSEKIALDLPALCIRIIFTLNPLLQGEPVKGLYDFTQQIGLSSLSGTNFFPEAKKLIEEKHAKKLIVEQKKGKQLLKLGS